MQGASVGIRVGTAVATLVKTGERIGHTTVRYRDFEDARASERRSHLLASVQDESSYTALEPNPNLGLPFKPRRVEADYLAWPRLPEFFDISFAGVKTSRDALLVDIDREVLEARMKQYLDSSISDEELARLCPDAMVTTKRFDAVQVRQSLRERALRSHQGPVDANKRQELLSYAYRPWQILRYTYRPFDVRWIYWEPETKLLDEKRIEALPEIMPGNRFLESRQRESGDHFSRGAIASSLPDNFGNGLSTFFPFWRSVYGVQAGKEFGQVAIPNIGLGWQYLYELYSREAIEDGDAHSYLHHHVVATMHTPRYRTENADALLNDWPRIPLPANADSSPTPPASATVSPNYSTLNPTSNSPPSGIFSAASPSPTSSPRAHPTATAATPPASPSPPAGEVVDRATLSCPGAVKRPNAIGILERSSASQPSQPRRT